MEHFLSRFDIMFPELRPLGIPVLCPLDLMPMLHTRSESTPWKVLVIILVSTVEEPLDIPLKHNITCSFLVVIQCSFQ